MGSLSGKTILIGKEPGQNRLLVAVQTNGGYKTAVVGEPGCVPACVSRCLPQQGKAHAKIEVGNDGTVKVTNLKPENVTYVNGSEIVSKTVAPDAKVELGMERYDVNLSVILNTATRILAEPAAPQGGESPQASYNIAHLETVWNTYHDGLRSLREKQKRVNLIRSGCGIFTMCAMPCIFFFGPIGYVLTSIGVLGNIYSFVGLRNDNSADAQEKMLETFQDSYVCPKCGKFLGGYSYRMMKKQYGMKCPYCKSNYVEE
jgi:DNA-directed RNA polymerase subunit RPC12/RpoP